MDAGSVDLGVLCERGRICWRHERHTGGHVPARNGLRGVEPRRNGHGHRHRHDTDTDTDTDTDSDTLVVVVPGDTDDTETEVVSEPEDTDGIDGETGDDDTGDEPYPYGGLGAAALAGESGGCACGAEGQAALGCCRCCSCWVGAADVEIRSSAESVGPRWPRPWGGGRSATRPRRCRRCRR